MDNEFDQGEAYIGPDREHRSDPYAASKRAWQARNKDKVRQAHTEYMRRYRATHGSSLRIYWRERKRVERAAAKSESSGD